MARRPCRICHGIDLVEVLDLGEQPHCNSFLRKDQLDAPEAKWPLRLLFCQSCHLVQLSEVVDPNVMFGEYLYVSGTTTTLREHFRRIATGLIAEFELGQEALVVDIGSNDGTFLRQFLDQGLRGVGVDPASNISAMANASGVETIDAFFSEEIASSIRAAKGPAELITAAGVFFHIDDMDDVCRGVAKLLADDGLLHVQAIYLGSMLEQRSFDNVYHEHVSYYTLGPLCRLFDRFNMTVFDVVHSPIHGGSLLVNVCHAGARPVRDSVDRMLEDERQRGYDTLGPYLEFASNAKMVRERLRDMVKGLNQAGKVVAAFGAPAKGNTLLNYCALGPDMLRYAAEKAPLKIGLFTPGMHLPVIDETIALADPPDYFLMLPWNFAEELLARNQPYREAGGKFILPLPEPRIV